mgnify:CR=1 FL=1
MGYSGMPIPDDLRPRRYPPERTVPTSGSYIQILDRTSLHETDDSAIWLMDVRVYASGIAFRIEGELAAHHSPPAEGQPFLKHMNLGRTQVPSSGPPIRVSARLSGGVIVSSAWKRLSEVPDDLAQPWLDGGTFYSVERSVRSAGDYFLSPLPLQDKVALEFEYPEYGMPLISIALDERRVRDARMHVSS